MYAQRLCTTMFTAALFVKAPNGRQSQRSSIGQWINRTRHIHTYPNNVMLFSKKRIERRNKMNESQNNSQWNIVWSHGRKILENANEFAGEQNVAQWLSQEEPGGGFTKELEETHSSCYITLLTVASVTSTSIRQNFSRLHFWTRALYCMSVVSLKAVFLFKECKLLTHTTRWLTFKIIMLNEKK